MRNLLAILLLLLATAAYAGGEKKGLKLVRAGEYAKGTEKLAKALAKDSTNAIANYGMALYYYYTDHAHYKLDSANYFVLKAIGSLPLPEKEAKKFAKLGVRSATIGLLNYEINEAAYQQARQQHSIAAYQYFIDAYQDSSLVPLATKHRNELAFSKAQNAGDFKSFKQFIEMYPDAEQYTEAVEIYEYLYYRNTTADSSWQVFKTYLEEKPNGAYAGQAQANYERLLFLDYAADASIPRYEAFLKEFSNSPYAKQAQDSLWVLSTPLLTLGELESFIERYPNNRNISKAWHWLYWLYTADDKPESYAAFLQRYPNTPLLNTIKQDEYWLNRNKTPFEEDGLWGFIDTADGAILLEPKYEEVEPFSNILALVLNDWGYYFYNARNEQIAGPFDNAQSFENAAAIVANEVNGKAKLGFVNRGGEYITAPKYDDAYDFTENLALVGKKGKGYGYINYRGELLIPYQYQDALPFAEGLAAVEAKNGWHFINKEGVKAVYGEFQQAKSFSEGLAAVSLDGDNWGYINTKGEFVIEPSYAQAGNFKNGAAEVMIWVANPKDPSLQVLELYLLQKDGTLRQP